MPLLNISLASKNEQIERRKIPVLKRWLFMQIPFSAISVTEKSEISVFGAVIILIEPYMKIH